MSVSLKSTRRLMLEKQLITKSLLGTKESVYHIVDTLGCLQIDTINVVERAHYLTLWSRLGTYDKEHLHHLAYEDRELFEHWAHGVCYIPFKDYRFYLPQIMARRETMSEVFTQRTDADPTILENVLKRVSDQGPLSSKDFDGTGGQSGWWSWKPAKLALEMLYRAGYLLVHHRHNFQKYYDLTENILPSKIDVSKPREEERVSYFILKTLGALGLVKSQTLREYYQNYIHKLGTTKQLQDQLENYYSEGKVEKYSVEGDSYPYYCLPEDSTRLQGLEAGDFGYDGVKLLVYFDNLLWNRKRVQQLFGFESKLEVYLPKEKRVYGYYHLPVLFGDRLVARLNPKMDRQDDVLIIRGYWLEDGFKPSEDYQNKLETTLEDFARFHGTQEISWQLS